VTGRANFIARLRATNPTKRAVLVMGHMDVVGVDTTKWTTPPFTATVRTATCTGRGAIDDKGMLADALAAMQQLAAAATGWTATSSSSRPPPRRAGRRSASTGAVEALRPDQGREFALNEGGRVRVADGRVVSVNIQTTEKLSYNIVAKATGPSGHGSVPLPTTCSRRWRARSPRCTPGRRR
jgi:acetylornithine deacetylase/succinyl-diaminopimelate desuccinylase-like protein